jgi:hypothetical protein
MWAHFVMLRIFSRRDTYSRRSAYPGYTWAVDGCAASPVACRRLSPPSVEFARHATGVIGVMNGAVEAGYAGRGEVSQRRNAFGPVATACLPQVKADKRLRAWVIWALGCGRYSSVVKRNGLECHAVTK